MGVSPALRRLVVIVSMALIQLTSVPIVAAADTATCADFSTFNKFAGNWITGSSLAGAEATIESQALNYCTPVPAGSDPTHANFVWDALDPNDSTGLSIVQIGLAHCYDVNNLSCEISDPTYVFRAWGRSHNSTGCSGFSDVLPLPFKVASMPQTTGVYTTVKTSSGYQMKLNGTVESSVALSSICWTPKRASWLGENWDRADAIGGSSGNHVVVGSALYAAQVGGIWGSPQFTTGSPCTITSLTRYKCSVTTNRSFELWTVQP